GRANPLKGGPGSRLGIILAEPRRHGGAAGREAKRHLGIAPPAGIEPAAASLEIVALPLHRGGQLFDCGTRPPPNDRVPPPSSTLKRRSRSGPWSLCIGASFQVTLAEKTTPAAEGRFERPTPRDR